MSKWKPFNILQRLKIPQIENTTSYSPSISFTVTRIEYLQYTTVHLIQTILNLWTNLLRKSVYSACLMSPVLIMMVWKHWRSMAHNLQSVAALMVAVLLQLYNMASSPNTFLGAIVLRYLFSRETSTRPSVKNGKNYYWNVRIVCWRCGVRVFFLVLTFWLVTFPGVGRWS